MPEWKIFLAHTLTVFNVLLAFYFVAGNGVYTLLMLMSLVSVWLHNRRLAYEGLDLLSESTVTPPVTIVMPAWNEQDAIVDSVRSVLKTQYPRLEVIAVDDGSTDSTLERLIAAFDLVRVDFIYRPLLPTKPVRAFYLSHQVPHFPGGQQGERRQAGRPERGHQPVPDSLLLHAGRRLRAGA